MTLRLPSRRTFIDWCARLVLIAYAFQLGAIDHLAPTSAAVASLDAHADHCHGDPSGCGNTASLTNTLAESVVVPLAPAATLMPVRETSRIPEGVAISGPEQPPQVAISA